MPDAQLLEGKILAAKVQEEIKADVQKADASHKPRLVSIQVKHNPVNAEEVKHAGSADWYIGAQEKLAQKLGIIYERVLVEADQAKVESAVRSLNDDPSCHGVFLAMPFPSPINSEKILSILNPLKDVEGVTPASLGNIVLRKAILIPSTAYAAFLLLKHPALDLKGKRAVIIGQSPIVGSPLQLLLRELRVTMIICNSGTSPADLQKFVSESDIVIACAGQPGMIKGSWIKEGAIVIDIGTTEVNGKLTGDVEFEEAKKRAGFITPVPGGVGPLTVTMLMKNLSRAYKEQSSRK